MLPDYNEYAEARKKRLAERTQERRPQLEMISQAAVKAELLTGQQHWDYFLSLIEGAIEVTQNHKEAFERLVMDPATSDEDVKKLRINAFLCAERIMAWRAVMTMPKELIEQGEKARTLLERVPDVGTDSEE